MEQNESTPWGTGLLVSALVTALVALGIYAFGAALADINWFLAAVINVVAVGGAAPSVWRWRTVAVVRWVVYGAAAGVAVGWLGLLAAAI
jgi:hypothetical protein